MPRGLYTRDLQSVSTLFYILLYIFILETFRGDPRNIFTEDEVILYLFIKWKESADLCDDLRNVPLVLLGEIRSNLHHYWRLIRSLQRVSRFQYLDSKHTQTLRSDTVHFYSKSNLLR